MVQTDANRVVRIRRLGAIQAATSKQVMEDQGSRTALIGGGERKSGLFYHT